MCSLLVRFVFLLPKIPSSLIVPKPFTVGWSAVAFLSEMMQHCTLSTTSLYYDENGETARGVSTSIYCSFPFCPTLNIDSIQGQTATSPLGTSKEVKSWCEKTS